MRKIVMMTMALFTVTSLVSGNAAAASYEVTSGDSLWDISQSHGVSIEDLKQHNQLTSDVIYPNDRLEIPKDDTTSYTVQTGDSLWSIAEKQHISISRIKELNHITTDIINPGMNLIIDNKNTIEEKSTNNNIKESKKEITVTATAYTASCNGCSGITATGINLNTHPDQKVIAVDPSVIPLGSEVIVEGYGKAIAGDTGGAIKGNKIDLYMTSTEDAIKFGRQKLKVKIIN